MKRTVIFLQYVSTQNTILQHWGKSLTDKVWHTKLILSKLGKLCRRLKTPRLLAMLSKPVGIEPQQDKRRKGNWAVWFQLQKQDFLLPHPPTAGRATASCGRLSFATTAQVASQERLVWGLKEAQSSTMHELISSVKVEYPREPISQEFYWKMRQTKSFVFGGLFHEEFLIILNDSPIASGLGECPQCIPCPTSFSFPHAS